MATIAEQLGPETAETYRQGLVMLDVIMRITHEDHPTLQPVVGALCDVLATLMLRVADLEAQASTKT